MAMLSEISYKPSSVPSAAISDKLIGVGSVYGLRSHFPKHGENVVAFPLRWTKIGT